MTKFARGFEVLSLREHLAASPDGVISVLFQHWKLPGEKGGPGALRVAVRNGYLNLYVGGQSVARIDASRGQVTIQIHKKYFCSARNGTAAASGIGQELVTLNTLESLGRENGAKVPDWIKTAASYCGDEKLFVDELIAANPGVVDVEMALPGDDRLRNEKGKKVAPRMDLVTVVDNDRQPYLNFWEAKCANNRELRAAVDIDIANGAGASVVRQLKRYVQWLTLEGREQQVVEAFQNTGRVLNELADTFGKNKSHPAIQAWSLLATTAPRVVRQPAVVVANYSPRRPTSQSADSHAKKAKSFAVHRERLRHHGIVTLEIHGDGGSPILPPLALTGSLGAA